MKIRDIARLAGVSAATVSRVFSHHPNVRNEIRDKVLEIARQHGYHPKVSLKQRNVVILLPANEIYPIRNCLEMVMMALTLKLPQRGFRLEVLPMNNLDRLDNVQFCGAVAIGADPEDVNFRTWSARFSAPLVLVDRDPPRGCDDICSVRSDETQGMTLAIKHLYDRGCRKIGCIIHGSLAAGNAACRRDAVVAALGQLGCPVNDALIQVCADDAYVETIGKMLKHGIDALFCPGGNAGIVAAYALSLFNRRVPQDISLLASEHKFFSRYAIPPQTTITQNHKALAEIVCDILEARLAGRTPEMQYVLPYELISRDSVRLASLV